MHRPKNALSPFLSALLGGVIALALGIAAVATGLISVDNSDDSATATVAQGPIATDTAPASTGDRTVGQVYQQDGQGVAYIEAVEKPSGSASPFGQQSSGGTATGSGILMDDQGHVLTNAHVVDGSSSVTVKFGDGDALDAKVLGIDDSTDVAVLGVDPDQVDANPLELGNSDDVKVGDPAVAIGNPYGLDRTVTTGIISALQRQISAPNGFTISDVLQTDAAINPGNSGGPADKAGLEGGDATVTEDGQQVRAGGDVITAIDGQPVSGMEDLISVINGKDPGDTVTLDVIRDGDKQQIDVDLGNRPDDATG